MWATNLSLAQSVVLVEIQSDRAIQGKVLPRARGLGNDTYFSHNQMQGVNDSAGNIREQGADEEEPLQSYVTTFVCFQVAKEDNTNADFQK